MATVNKTIDGGADANSDAAVLAKAAAVKKRLRDLWKGEYVKLGIHKFFASWLFTGFLAIVMPAWKYHFEKRAYQKSNQYYNYLYSMNYVADDDHHDDDVEMLPWYDRNDCRWWKLRCKPIWMNSYGEYRDQVAAAAAEDGGEAIHYHEIPNWFSGWGNVNNGGGGTTDYYLNQGTMTDTAQLKFVYWWQLLIFLGILFYGPWIISKESKSQGCSTYGVHTLFLIILLWTNFSFLNMWTLANGAIYTQGPALDEVGGFYCQFSVFMFMTNFWYFIWGCIFSPLLLRECMLVKRSSSRRSPRRSRSSHKAGSNRTLSSETTRGRSLSRGRSSSRGGSLSPGPARGGYFPPHISAFMVDPCTAGGSYLPYSEANMMAYKPRSEPAINTGPRPSPFETYVNGVPGGAIGMSHNNSILATARPNSPHQMQARPNSPHQMQAVARPISPHSPHQETATANGVDKYAIAKGVDVAAIY